MEHSEIRVRVKQWLDVAKNDLRSSRILYYAGVYNNSYFLFQQAVEKANKTYAFWAEVITEAQFEDIGHNPLIIYKRTLERKIGETKHLIKALDRFPNAKKNPLLKEMNFHKYYRSLKDSLHILEAMKKEKYDFITEEDIYEFIENTDEFADAEIELPHYSSTEFKENLKNIGDLITAFNPEDSDGSKAEFERLISSKDGIIAFHKLLKLQVQLGVSTSFIEYVFVISAFLTVNHVSSTRYIEGDQHPMKIYTKKLPVVDLQPEIMDMFENGVLEFEWLLGFKALNP